MSYLFVYQMGEMPVLEHISCGVQVWVQTKVRKNQKCAVCGKNHGVGASLFRPITNGKNRSERICPTCIQGLRGRG